MCTYNQCEGVNCILMRKKLWRIDGFSRNVYQSIKKYIITNVPPPMPLEALYFLETYLIVPPILSLDHHHARMTKCNARGIVQRSLENFSKVTGEKVMFSWRGMLSVLGNEKVKISFQRKR